MVLEEIIKILVAAVLSRRENLGIILREKEVVRLVVDSGRDGRRCALDGRLLDGGLRDESVAGYLDEDGRGD